MVKSQKTQTLRKDDEMRIIGNNELVKKEIVVQVAGQSELRFPLLESLRYDDPMPINIAPLMPMLIYRIKEQIDSQTYVYAFAGIEKR